MITFEEIKSLKWPRDKEKAIEVQRLLAGKVRLTPLRRAPSSVAGVDAALSGDKIIGVACLFSYPALEPREESHAVRKALFPYIPGLLSFREGPAVIEAVEGLSTRPDVILFDGQGIAHPRGLGIASFFGVLLNIPTIGTAKSRLIGEYREPGPKKGDWTPLRHEGRTVGAVLRTRDNVKPLFVSPGHRIDLKGSIEVVLGCAVRFRLAEPVRRADMLSKRLAKERMGLSRPF